MFVLGDFQEVSKNGVLCGKQIYETNQIVSLITMLRYLVIGTIGLYVAVKPEVKKFFKF